MSFNDGFTKNAIAAPTTPAVSGNALVYDGTQWVASTIGGAGGGGDITDVNAGTNLVGGGTSGSITISMDTDVSGLNSLQTTDLTASNAYIFNGLTVNGTASIGQLNTLNQQSLVIGDKYITILSGGVDHNTLDASGILWGSGSSGSTVNELGSNAHVRFRSSTDSLEIFPNLTVSGTISAGGSVTGSAFSGDGANVTNLTSSNITNFTSDVRAQFSAGTNITINNGIISASGGGASSNVYSREWHVSTGSGNDITGNGTLLSPYRTVAAAITAASSQGGDQIVLHPGTYLENVTMGKINTTICAAQGSNGGEVNFSGTMIISQSTAPSSSIRLFGIAVSNLVHNGTGSLYLEDCKVNNTFTKATTAYFQSTNCDFNKDIFIVSGGIASFQGGSQSASGSSFIINDPGAYVTIRDSIATYSPVVISGTLGFNDCAILATSSGGPAVTSLSPSSIVIMVDSTTLDSSSLSTKVSIGGSFSYSNSVFNKTASTLGTTLITGPSIADFETIRTNAITGSTTTGSLALFTIVTGSAVTGSTARFTSITGSTVTGSTALFTTMTGSTVTGSLALFTTITGSNISYTPAVSGNWANPAPTTVKSAIDRLAAAVFTLRGNSPIP